MVKALFFDIDGTLVSFRTHEVPAVTALGNTKQKGIDEIIRHFDIRSEETAAFGDGGNDISMLRHAGVGIAMGNARGEVKAAADRVTASVDDDGIARALSHLGIVHWGGIRTVLYNYNKE